MTLAVNQILQHCATTQTAVARLFRLNTFLLACVFLLSGCGKQSPDNEQQLHVFSGQVMGTWYNIKYLPPSDAPLSTEQIDTQLHARLSRVDELMSTYKADSEVSRFNRAEPEQWFEVSGPTFEVLALSQSISEKTAGAFDVSVASLVNLWGFGPKKQTADIPDEQSLAAVLTEIGYKNLVLHGSETKLLKKTPLQVDLSAIAKGFGVDQAADYLDQMMVLSYLVEVGGEIRARGLKPNGKSWRIAIESPNGGEREVHLVVDVTNRAVATSGDYRNYFEKDGQRFSHTINPKTGYPITHNLASVTVVNETAAMADALATAFSVLGFDEAMRYAKEYNVAVYFIVKDEEGFVGKASDAFEAITHERL